MTKKFLFDIISKHKLAVLSTVSNENKPESAVVGITVTEDVEIIFDTTTDSRKYKNLIDNPHIAFVGWDGETTFQFEGLAESVTEPSRLKKIKEIYFKKFPDGIEREKWPNITYFCVQPKWIRYSDFRKVEPLIEEIRF